MRARHANRRAVLPRAVGADRAAGDLAGGSIAQDLRRIIYEDHGPLDRLVPYRAVRRADKATRQKVEWLVAAMQDQPFCWKHPALRCSGECQYIAPADVCLNDEAPDAG